MQKINPTELEKHPPSKSFSAEEIQDAGNLVRLLLLAWKNYGLYPEGHIATSKALKKLKTGFENFFSTHKDLQITVERKHLLCGKTVVHEVPSEAPFEDIVFPLYRDGIQMLRFRQGLTMKELAYFFNTLIKHRVLMEEAEGDVVTGLVDGDLAHIDFDTVDIFWNDQPLLDFSSLNSQPPEMEKLSYHEEPHRSETYARSIADPAISKKLWEISPAEREDLQKKVLEEENWANTEDVFDVLLVILHSQTDRYNFSLVLDFILEEVVETIEQGEFSLLLNLFQSLHQLLYRDASIDLSWMQPLINRFFQDLSSPEIFDLITDKLMILKDNDTEKIQALRQVLLYFSPEVIPSLGPVILQNKSSAVRNMILEVIEYLCLRDMTPLEKLLEHSEKRLGEKLLPMTVTLKGGRTNSIFLKMTKHPSKNVRREAVRVLLARDPRFVLKLFPLIDDTSDSVRKDILDSIAKQRASELENMMLKYLQEDFDNENPKHILACYKALGSCGSAKAIPFLREVLFSRGWDLIKTSDSTIHRTGAAAALFCLDCDEARDILLAGSKSRFKVIRQACQAAITNNEASGVNSNGQ